MGRAKRARSVVLSASVAVVGAAGAYPAASNATTQVERGAPGLAVPSTSSAAPCTDSFVGASNAKWSEPANWNTGRVPTREDVVCIPAGVTASLWFKTGVPASVTVRAVHGGSVFTNTELYLRESSTLESVGVNGTDLVVDEGAELVLSHELFINGYSGLTGSGTITLERGAVGELGELGCGQLLVNNTHVVNRGTLHVGRRYVGGEQVGLLNHAQIINEGVLGLDSEVVVSEDCARQTHGATIYRYSPTWTYVGEALINRGTVQTEDGVNAVTVSLPVTNDGTIAARQGALVFSGGGVPTECSTGSWQSEGAQLSLAAGTFNLAPGTSLAGVEVSPGAVIAGCPAQLTSGSTANPGKAGGNGAAGNGTNVGGDATAGSSRPLGGARVVCVVPRIQAGASLKHVRELLAERHCRVGRVHYKRTRKVRAGRVVAPNARAGEHIPDHAAVGVTVARAR